MKQKLHGVQLITYADSLGSDLRDLHQVLNKHFCDTISSVHILPFYPSSADRGFAPTTHFDMDSSFGSWKDLHAIAQDYGIMSDLIVNHISTQSDIFRDFLKKGSRSPYADYFITPTKFSRRILPHRKSTHALLSTIENTANALRRHDKIFHIKGVNKYTLKKITRPRPGIPFVTFFDARNNAKDLWCTFSADQVDLDLSNRAVRALLIQYIHHLSAQGVNMLRLDAVGYAIKKRDTTNFMIPETYDLITELAKVAHQHNMTVLPEVHGHYTHQLRIAQTPGVDYTYDFQLPLLALHTLFTTETAALVNWIAIRPQNIVTTLDTHDGLPVVDVEDLLSQEDTINVVEQMTTNGGNAALRASGESSDNVDIYQINCTYYSALGENDHAYVAARALQCFLPGIPQIYYVGLLAGINDIALLEKTNNGRDINRHYYTQTEIARACERPVVKRLLKILHLRNNHPAFNGDFHYTHTRHTLTLTWRNNVHLCRARINFAQQKTTITYTHVTTHRKYTFTA